MNGFIGTIEAAKRCDVTRQTIWRWVREGRIRGKLISPHVWVIREVDVDREAALRQLERNEAVA